MKFNKLLTAYVFGVSFLLVGCGGVGALPMGTTAKDVSLYGKKHTLRYNRNANQLDRYKAKYLITTEGVITGMEELEKEIIYRTMGKVDSRDDWNRVVVFVYEKKRMKTFRGTNGIRTPTTKVRPPYQPNITPNFGVEPKTSGVKYLPINKRGVIAFRKSTPYHWATNDSLYYLFPVLPKDEVSIGDKWSFKIPVTTERLHQGHEFELIADYSFDSIESIPYAPGKTTDCAIISYTYHGRYDSDEKDLGTGKTSGIKSRHIIEGSGIAYFSIKAGKLIAKKDSYTINSKTILPDLSSREKMPNNAIKTKTQEVIHKTEFIMRTMEINETLSNDAPSR